MRKDTFVFYFLGAMILTLSGFFLFSKNICSEFLGIMANSNSGYINDLPSIKRKQISFDDGFIKDSRFLALNREWLAPTSFSELTSASSSIKSQIDFKVGNQNLFKVDETKK